LGRARRWGTGTKGNGGRSPHSALYQNLNCLGGATARGRRSRAVPIGAGFFLALADIPRLPSLRVAGPRRRRVTSFWIETGKVRNRTWSPSRKAAKASEKPLRSIPDLDVGPARKWQTT